MSKEKIALEIGKKIKILRGKKSQDVFASELGISRGALSFYENGERTPDAKFVYKVCILTGVSADWLLGIPLNMQANDEIANQAAKYNEITNILKQIINS